MHLFNCARDLQHLQIIPAVLICFLSRDDLPLYSNMCEVLDSRGSSVQCLSEPVSYTHLDVYKRQDHKSISFLKRCKLSHGRLTRWILLLQEYDLKWEYIHGRKNVVADVLSRVDIDKQTFEGEKESILKVYHILSSSAGLQSILEHLSTHQQADSKLISIITRLEAGDKTISQYYKIHNGILF